MEVVEPKGSCASLQRTDLGGENDLHDPRQRFSSVMSDFIFSNHSENETLDQVAKGATCDQQGPLWAAGEGLCRWPTPPVLTEARELESSEVPPK